MLDYLYDTYCYFKNMFRTVNCMTDEELEEYFNSERSYLNSLTKEEREELFKPNDLLP